MSAEPAWSGDGAPPVSRDSGPPRVGIFVSFSGRGGVERMVCNLAEGMQEAGVAVDLVLARARGEHLDGIPAGVRVVHLHARHTFSALGPLVRYLRRERPAALLAAKDRAIRTALVARRLAGGEPRLVGRLGTTVSAALAGRGALRRWWWYRGMRLFYGHVDLIVAVSEGVAADVRAITGLTAERVRVIPNPVVGPRLHQLAAVAVDHPWLAADAPPVILGVGRLTRQKDFPTLVRAFARLRGERDARLMILGEGGERPALEALARRLGVEGDVALPGFAANPYAPMARAALFVLSSAWEGSPNALTEAMALGTPVVATDCPSGPREILRGGRVAPLVPVGDDEALAAAMADQLRAPAAAPALAQAVAAYRIDRSAAAYLRALGVLPPGVRPDTLP